MEEPVVTPARVLWAERSLTISDLAFVSSQALRVALALAVGHGGGGGGGCGGASYDIFIWGLGAIEADYSSNVFPISALEQTSGEGGSGGNASNTAVGLGDSGSTGAYGNIMVRTVIESL